MQASKNFQPYRRSHKVAPRATVDAALALALPNPCGRKVSEKFDSICSVDTFGLTSPS